MANLVKLNKDFLSGNAQANIEIIPPDSDVEVVTAFANNTSFPYRQIELGKISAKAEIGDTIKFGDGAGQVVFGGSAGAFAGLGVYPDPKKLLAALTVDENIAPGMDLKQDPESLYVALRWGYDVSASAKGSIALGAPGSFTFGASGKRDALYAVIRRLNKDTGALTAVEKIAGSWMLPSQIDQLGDLEPGTWLIAEVNGSVALSMGVQYGYDFNWVREAKLLGLAGDIGLRLQMGVSAALSFNASGNFAVVIGRDSENPADQILRFRLFRLREKGWGFAFNAGASVQADFNDFLPEFDEFIKAVFGVHGAQVLNDLKAVEKWTNPDQSLGEILSGEGVEYGKDFIEKVTGLDPENEFNEAIKRLSGFVKTWNDLPHNIATRIWKVVEKSEDLASIRRIAETIRDANMDTVKKPITELLSDVDFFRTPAGAWLEAAAARGIFNALNSTHEFELLQEAARKTLGILDGSTFEGILEKLQSYVEEHLKLEELFPGFDKLKDLIGVDSLQDLDQVSFDKLDTWLKAKLAAFLDKKLDELKLGELNEIRKSIFLFIKRGRTFYEKTLKALNRKYDFNFAYTYQSTTTGTALLDFTLDFSQPGVIGALKLALSGKYDDLLVQQTPGVKLNVGTLTHQIERHSHVEINLPWFKSATDHINKSLAKIDAVDNDGGRLFCYELEATDIVEEKNKRLSSLAIGGFLKAQANQVTVHNTNELTYSYTFRQVKKDMKGTELTYQLKPYVQNYFGQVFKPIDAFDDWIDVLDTQIDILESNGPLFGNVLVGLNLSLPSVLASAWLKAPGKSSGAKVHAYLEMSRRLQAKLKEILPFYYFANLENYEKEKSAAEILLVYAAIPPSTYVRFEGNKLTLNLNDDYYWDFVEANNREKMVRSAATKSNLEALLDRTHSLLERSGMTDTAKHYKRDQAEAIQGRVAKDARLYQVFWGLVYAENQIVKGAREAGYDIARFTSLDNTKPSEAIQALANFGSELTRAFNEKLQSTYGGGALRPLGTALFVEAASVLGPDLPVAHTAMLELTVLKKQAQFQMPNYLKGEVPEKADVLLQERIINIP